MESRNEASYHICHDEVNRRQGYQPLGSFQPLHEDYYTIASRCQVKMIRTVYLPVIFTCHISINCWAFDLLRAILINI